MKKNVMILAGISMCASMGLATDQSASVEKQALSEEQLAAIEILVQSGNLVFDKRNEKILIDFTGSTIEDANTPEAQFELIDMESLEAAVERAMPTIGTARLLW